jgi:hypothetical protein
MAFNIMGRHCEMHGLTGKGTGFSTPNVLLYGLDVIERHDNV